MEIYGVFKLNFLYENTIQCMSCRVRHCKTFKACVALHSQQELLVITLLSNDITLRRITSHCITSHTSRHITSHHTTSNQITSRHTTPYHITSHHKLCHVTLHRSHCVTLQSRQISYLPLFLSSCKIDSYLITCQTCQTRFFWQIARYPWIPLQYRLLLLHLPQLCTHSLDTDGQF